MKESRNQHDIFKHVNSRSDARVFRNNVGVAYQGKIDKNLSSKLARQFNERIVVIRNFRVIRFGLHVGSGDLIGWVKRLITPSMVGKTIAQFLSPEVKKSRGGKLSDEQVNWIDQVNNFGGCAGEVRTPEDVDNLIDRNGNVND